jgi:hypothetical protein
MLRDIGMLRPMVPTAKSCVIWESHDGVIRCTETISDSEYDVAIVVAGETISSCRFADVNAAARETDRLRKLFIG